MNSILKLNVVPPQGPVFSVSVAARHPAEFSADLQVDETKRPARYAVWLRGQGVPKIMGEGRDAIEAALTLGHRLVGYLNDVDDRLSTNPPKPYLGEVLERSS